MVNALMRPAEAAHISQTLSPPISDGLKASRER